MNDREVNWPSGRTCIGQDPEESWPRARDCRPSFGAWRQPSDGRILSAVRFRHLVHRVDRGRLGRRPRSPPAHEVWTLRPRRIALLRHQPCRRRRHRWNRCIDRHRREARILGRRARSSRGPGRLRNIEPTRREIRPTPLHYPTRCRAPRNPRHPPNPQSPGLRRLDPYRCGVSILLRGMMRAIRRWNPHPCPPTATLLDRLLGRC